MQNRLKLLWATLPLLAACSGVQVHTDFDPAAHFSRYKTYYWAKTPTTPNNPLMANRIVDQIDGQLAAKGWQKTAEGQADVALASHVTTREQEQVDTMYNNMGPGWYGPGMAGWGGNFAYGGMGVATTTVSTHTIGTLFLDMLDAKNHKAVWHGTAEGTVTNDASDNEKKVSEALAKMFKNFPPQALGARH